VIAQVLPHQNGNRRKKERTYLVRFQQIIDDLKGIDHDNGE